MAGIWDQIRDTLFGGDMKKVQTLSGGQNNLLNQLLQMLSGGGKLGQGFNQSQDYLQQLMNPDSEAVNQFTQPYMNQFNQQTVPGLAERFAGMGAQGGGLSSSGFGQALSSAGGNLQAQLAQLKAGLGQQAAGQLQQQYGNFAQQGLGTPAFGYSQPTQGLVPNLLTSYAGAGFPGIGNPFGGGNQYQQNPYGARR